MRTFLHCVFAAAAFLCAAPAATATEIVDRPELGKHFEAAGVSGTFVMLDADAGRLHVFDRERAARRFVPASTFKIFNGLVALETGVIKDEDELVPYGGTPQRLKAWERDMSLRDGMRVSSVPVYQELARRAGLERMRRYVQLVGYGNGEIGDVVDRFWLDGPLAISAVEQAFFANRLARRDLPFGERGMRIMRDILRQDEASGHDLFAKTGWGDNGGIGLGWWVGWVEREGKIYAFALNIDLRRDGDAAKRQTVARACLTALQVL
ncbi:MAG TPA: class D beta-lactamase [Paucimonas sp.]|nr:class D beta-lactamase [Paucimonas sp.]